MSSVYRLVQSSQSSSTNQPRPRNSLPRDYLSLATKMNSSCIPCYYPKTRTSRHHPTRELPRQSPRALCGFLRDGPAYSRWHLAPSVRVDFAGRWLAHQVVRSLRRENQPWASCSWRLGALFLHQNTLRAGRGRDGRPTRVSSARRGAAGEQRKRKLICAFCFEAVTHALHESQRNEDTGSLFEPSQPAGFPWFRRWFFGPVPRHTY